MRFTVWIRMGMKHRNLWMAILVCLCGCTGTYKVTYYDLNREYAVNHGSPMVTREECRGDSYQQAAALKQCSLRQEIIYSGRQGDTVSFAYKEYAGEGGNYSSQPLFAESFALNLKQYSIVSYKDIYMKVIEANEKSIRFMVIDPSQYYAVGFEGGK